MFVLKTSSPYAVRGSPKASPWTIVPSSRTREPFIATGRGETTGVLGFGRPVGASLSAAPAPSIAKGRRRSRWRLQAGLAPFLGQRMDSVGHALTMAGEPGGRPSVSAPSGPRKAGPVGSTSEGGTARAARRPRVPRPGSSLASLGRGSRPRGGAAGGRTDPPHSPGEGDPRGSTSSGCLAPET